MWAIYIFVKAELDHNNSETFGGKIQTHRSKTLYSLYWLNQTTGAPIHYPIKASGDLKIATAFHCLSPHAVHFLLL
jgi:hypothetical protein